MDKNDFYKPLKEIIVQNSDVSLADLLKNLLVTNAEDIQAIMTKSMVESAEKILRESGNNFSEILRQTSEYKDLNARINYIVSEYQDLNERVCNILNILGNTDRLPYYYHGIVNELDEIRNIMGVLMCDVEDLKNR